MLIFDSRFLIWPNSEISNLRSLSPHEDIRGSPRIHNVLCDNDLRHGIHLALPDTGELAALPPHRVD